MSKKLNLVINVDANDKELNRLLGELEDIPKKANGASRGINNFESSLLRIGATVGGITALNSAISSSVTAFRELETATAGVAKTTGFSSEEIAKLRDNFRDMTSEFKGFKTQDLLSIAEAAGQLGITGVDNISKFTKSMQMVSMTTDLTAEQASSSFARLSNSLHLPLTKIDNIASAFNELSNTTTATVGDIVYFSQRMSGAATELGLSASEIGGLSATLKDVGMEAEVAGTSMNTVMLGMIKKTKDYAEVMGVPFEEFSQAIKDKPIKALQLFISKIGELDQASKLRALEKLKLTGDGVTQTMLKLSSNTELLTKNINTSNKAFDEATSIQKEYQAVSNTLDNALVSLQDSIDLAGESLVVKFSEPLKGGIDDLTNFISVLTTGEGELGTFGESLLVFGSLATAIGGATLAMKAFNIATRSNPLLMGAGVAIAGISAIGGYLNKYEKQLDTMNEKQKVAEAQRKANGLDAYGNKPEKVNISKQAALGNAYSSLFQQYNKDGAISDKESQQLKKIEDQIKATTQTIKKQGRALDKNYESQLKLSTQYSLYYDIAMRGDGKISKVEQKELNNLKNKMLGIVSLTKETKKLNEEKNKPEKSKRTYKPPVKPDKSAIKAHAKSLADRAKLTKSFEDKYKKSQLSKYDHSLYLLDQERDKYKSQNMDKLKIDKWYATEKEKILKEQSDKTNVWKSGKAKEQFNKTQWDYEIKQKALKASNVWSNGTAKKQFEEAKWQYDVEESEKENNKKKVDLWADAVRDMSKIFTSTNGNALSTIVDKFTSFIKGDKVDAGGIGSSLDALLGADTYAEEGANIGGTIGTAIGAYFGSPEAGRMAGEWGGVILGGLFGKTSVRGQGINITSQINQLEDLSSNVEQYVDFKKKSWFSSKKWTDTADLSMVQLDQLNSMYDSYDDLLSEFTDRNLGAISAGKYTDLSTPLVQSFFEGLIENTNTWSNNITNETFSTTEAMTKIWEEYAENLDQNALEVIGSKFQELSNQKNIFERWRLGLFKSDQQASKDQAKFDLDIAKRQLDQDRIGGVYVNNYVEKLNEAIKSGLTPAELEQWMKYGETLKKAGEAQINYDNILKGEKKKAHDEEIARVQSLQAVKVENYKQDKSVLSSVRSTILSASNLSNNLRLNYAESLYKDALKRGDSQDSNNYASTFIQLSNDGQIGVEAYNKTLSAINDLQLRFNEKPEIQIVANPTLEEQNSKLIELNNKLVGELQKMNENDEDGRNMFGQREVVVVDVA